MTYTPNDDDQIYLNEICVYCNEHLKFSESICVCGCVNKNYETPIFQYDNVVCNNYNVIANFEKYIAKINLNNILNHDTLNVMCSLFYMVTDYYNGSWCCERKNMPMLSFLTYKVCELVDLTDMIIYIKLPSSSTLVKLDQSFKECCKYYNWIYKPTCKSAYQTISIVRGDRTYNIQL